ncbi:MAG: hypothetical protein HFH38_06705 [Lachnospiraceae bacterium]|jgi:uncharacterized repeat protein (TIGR02543 family)|nr:hypothetical protein [Lachnospiraceae bacterium]
MKQKSVLKRILSLALSTALAVTMLPSQLAQAAGGTVSEAPEFPDRLAYFSFDESLTDGENAMAAVDGDNASINKSDTHNGEGGALELKGRSWLTLSKAGDAGDNLINGKKELTISYWSKTTSDNTKNHNAGWAWFASRDNEENKYPNEHYIGGIDTPGQYTAQRWNNSGVRKEAIEYQGSFSQWKMVTVVMAEHSTALYIDGKQVRVQTNEVMPLGDIITAGSKFMIGRGNWASDDIWEYYTGLIDDFAIYDGVLDASQVLYLYDGSTFGDVLEEEGFSVADFGLSAGEEGKVDVILPAILEGAANITYSIDNQDIASVDASGVVSAKAEGQAVLTVTVEAGGISKSQARKVTVYGANPAPLAVYDFNATESAPAGTLGEGVEKCVKGMGAYEGETVFESGRSGREGDFAVRTEEGKYGLKLPQKLQQNFTVSLWVKATVLPHWASSVLFVGRKTPETWISIGGNSNGNLICWSSGNRRNGSAKIEANQWTMFTLVQKGESVSIYQNGKKLEIPGTWAKGLMYEDQYISLGVNPWDDVVSGLYDDIKVYGVALSDGQVAATYAAENPKVESYAPVSVETREGVEPELPDTVHVEFVGGAEGTEEVQWPQIDPEQYANEGTFTVAGKLKYFDTEIVANVTVRPLSDSLLANYTFDGEVLADASGKKANAEKVNKVDMVDGLKGKAVSLPGGGANKGSVKLPEDLLVKDGKVQDDFTISMYVKVADKLQQSTALLLHGDKLNESWNSSTTRNHIALYNRDSNRDGEDGLWVEYHTKQDTSSMLGKKDASQTTADKWEHIAVVTKGSTGEAWLYKNGRQIDYKNNITVKASDLNGRLNYLGAADWEDPDYAGAFDELQVYDTVLQASEIKDICDSGFRSCLVKAMEGLEIGYAQGDSAANVTSSLSLPSTLKAADGVDIQVEWGSSDTDVVDSSGLVDRQDTDKEVTLTATVSVLDTSSKTGGKLCSEKKEFNITVKASTGVSFVKLDANIAKAEAVYEAAGTAKNYTEESVAALKKLIDDAKALKGKEDVTKEEVADAASGLAEAITGSTAVLKLKDLAQLNGVLAAHYPLARDAKDSTANHKDGTAKEKITFRGSEGAAFVKDTKQSRVSVIDLPTDLFQGKDQLTVSFWAKDTYSKRDENHAVFGIGSGTSADPNSAGAFKYLLVNPTKNGKLKVVLSKEKSYSGEKGFGNSNCVAPFEANQWIHVAVVLNGTKLAVYKDGALAGETDTGVTVSDLGELTSASIGNSIYGNTGDRDFEGFVKNFRIYHASLAAEQVGSIYGEENRGVDKAALQDAIAQAEASMGEGDSKQDDYTSGSWNALKEAYAQAIQVRDDATAIQEEADGAADALKEAIKGLASVVSLQEAIAAAKEVDKGNYSDTSWDNFQKAITAAEAILAQENPSEAEMAAAVKAIEDARSKLTDGSKSDLTNLIAEIRGMAEDYTAYSMEELLRFAEELDASLPEDASAEAVNKAVADLRAAMEGLVSVKELKEAIAKAKEVDLSQYLADGKAEFREALDYAQQIQKDAMSGAEVSKAVIMAACTNLDTARNALYSRKGLSDRIGEADVKLADSRYTTASKKKLEEAVKNALRVNVNPESTAADFRDAEEQLDTAMAQLVEKADASALQDLVGRVEALDEAGYTDASWKGLKEALATAKEVLGNDSSTAAALAAAEEALASAKDRLVERASVSQLNSLYADVASVGRLNASDYTSSSWAALQEAASNAAAAAEGKVKSEVVGSAAALKDAKAKLVNLTALKAAIADTAALSQADYTSATWAVFQDKLGKANITAANGSATQGDVDTAAQELNTAKNALARVSDLSGLKESIQRMESLLQGDYTVESKEKLRQEIAKAKAVTKEMPQAEVDKAIKALEQAEKELVKLVDKEDLKARVAEAQVFVAGVNEADGKYTSATWKNLKDALDAAQAAINKGNASESEVSSALRNLNEAISRLLVRGDKTSLNKQIAEAESLEESDYTKESWAALGKALAAAKAVQEEADALQNEVNDKAAALREARLALKIAAFTVTLDPANGEAPTVEHIVSGQLISEPEDPSRAGYVFIGWYVGDTLYDFGAPVITDLTIIAKWADLPSIAGASVKVEKAVYNGKARKPEVAVRMDGKLLVETIDYTVSYSNHVKVGQGTITITGIEGYTGKKIVKFNILPAKVKNVKLTAKKGGKAAVKFTKAAGVKGYQVTYSASSSFKSAKNKNITKNSVTLGGLKKNKVYYVKVRAYTIVNGKKVYGSYSTKVKVKIKK